MIVIDCERLKIGYTGIYSYCMNLVSAILKEAEGSDMQISCFLRKRNKGILGSGTDYSIYRSIYKYIFPYWLSRGGIWHSTFQFPAIMPSKGKSVLTVHDLNFLYENTAEGKEYWLKALQSNVDKATCLIAISEYTKNDILTHLDTGSKEIHVIYNGCEIYSGPVTRPAYVPERPFIYTLGATVEKKNFHVLPCLLKDNDYILIISGQQCGYADRIIEEARKEGVEDRVRFSGIVSEAEKHWYLKNCMAFAFPSIAEGFGLPALEAMYYGKPVFLSRHTSLPEIGGDSAFYFNYEFDRDLMRQEFRDGMEKYSSGIVTPEEIRRHAMSFSWEHAAREHIKLYRHLLSY